MSVPPSQMTFIFKTKMRDLLNYNFILIDKFRVLYSPRGLKRGKPQFLVLISSGTSWDNLQLSKLLPGGSEFLAISG